MPMSGESSFARVPRAEVSMCSIRRRALPSRVSVARQVPSSSASDGSAGTGPRSQVSGNATPCCQVPIHACLLLSNSPSYFAPIVSIVNAIRPSCSTTSSTRMVSPGFWSTLSSVAASCPSFAALILSSSANLPWSVCSAPCHVPNASMVGASVAGNAAAEHVISPASSTLLIVNSGFMGSILEFWPSAAVTGASGHRPGWAS